MQKNKKLADAAKNACEKIINGEISKLGLENFPGFFVTSEESEAMADGVMPVEEVEFNGQHFWLCQSIF